MSRNVDIVAIIVLLVGLMVVAETRSAVSFAVHNQHFHIDRDSGAVFVIPEAPRPPIPPLPQISFSFD